MDGCNAFRRIARAGLVSDSPLVLAAGLMASAPAQAQTWNAGTDLWGTATNWTPNTAPNSSSVIATVDNGGTAEVNPGTLFQVGTLNIGTGVSGARR